MGILKHAPYAIFLLGATGMTTTAIALDRPADPVVFTGASIPSLIGIEPGDLVAFRRFNSVWQQVPVQVDERAVIDFTAVYDGNASFGSLSRLDYTDAGTFTGSDPDPMLDEDDEIVFMAADSGTRASTISFSEPGGVVSNSGIEVKISDPLGGTPGYVYLFCQNGSLDPAAGQQYVTYTFNLLSGDYKTTYGLVAGPNPEDSTITTPYYERHFLDRWKCDVLRIFDGSASGVDILDRQKVLFAPGLCVRSEDTFSAAEGAFIVNKNGPVRAIRSYVGANSGPRTQRQHLYYARREDIRSFLRVHAIDSIMNFFDYSPDAAGMHYFNDYNLSGVLVDGVPDIPVAGSLTWELIEGAQGSLVAALTLTTDIADPTYGSYYLDDSTPPDTQCTGDAFAYGSSGFWMDHGIPNTDPVMGAYYNYSLDTVLYYGAPGWTVANAQQYKVFANNPLQTTFADYKLLRGYLRDAWWSNQVDNDNDGYYSSMRLNWDPIVNGGSGTLTVFERLYYRASSSSTWILFRTTDPHLITDMVSSNVRYIDVNPNPYGMYDYMIEIYRTGQTYPDGYLIPTWDADLNDHKEEPAAQDGDTVILSDAWWSDQVDADGDTYYSTFRLNWNPDIADGSGTLSVFEKVFCKASSSSTWRLIHTSDTHSITDALTSDARYIDLSGDRHGMYDYKIEVYRSEQSSPDDYLNPSSDSDLDDHKEEMAEDAGGSDTAILRDAWLSAGMDWNGNGYGCSPFFLHWNADVADGSGTLSVFAKVYYRSSSSSTWQMLTDTFNFPDTITDMLTSDSCSYPIVSSRPYGTYDYRIEIYRSGQSLPDDYLDPSWDPDLNDHKEETYAEEMAWPLPVPKDAWWSNQIDSDGDGYYETFTLNWDVDVTPDNGVVRVFEAVWRHYRNTPYTPTLAYSAQRTITGATTSDSQHVDLTGQVIQWPIGQQTSGTCDYAIVFRTIMGPTLSLNDADLNGHKEEVETGPCRAALLVGIDHYNPAYVSGSLPSCVNDANGIREHMMETDPASRWPVARLQTLTDEAATKTTIRVILQVMAAQSEAGDVFVYFHSSHGGQYSGTDTFLCTYDADYTDAELASDLAGFNTDAKVVVIVDACHSGGLFQKGLGWPFAERVMAHYAAIKAAQLTAKSLPVPKDLGANIGFITACNYDETCWAGNPYSLYAGYVIEACDTPSANTNGDNEYQFWELYNYAAAHASAENPSQEAQCYNQALLQQLAAKAVTAKELPSVQAISPDSGPTAGSTTVTISGSGLTDTTSVTFDGMPATDVVVVSDTAVTVVTPAHLAGVVSVSVRWPSGAGAGDLYTYIAAPTVTSIAPDSGPTDGGTDVTIEGTDLTGTTSVTFDSTPATDVVVVSDTEIAAVTPEHSAGVVSVSVTTPGGTDFGNLFTYIVGSDQVPSLTVPVFRETPSEASAPAKNPSGSH